MFRRKKNGIVARMRSERTENAEGWRQNTLRPHVNPMEQQTSLGSDHGFHLVRRKTFSFDSHVPVGMKRPAHTEEQEAYDRRDQHIRGDETVHEDSVRSVILDAF